MRASYPTVEQMIDAYSRKFAEFFDDDDPWKGYAFGVDSDAEMIDLIPRAGRKNRWSMILNTSDGEAEVAGPGVLAPEHIPDVMKQLRARIAQLRRVNHEKALGMLRAEAERIARAQADLRFKARYAVQHDGLKKVDVAEAVGISRPTLDAWLS